MGALTLQLLAKIQLNQYGLTNSPGILHSSISSSHFVYLYMQKLISLVFHNYTLFVILGIQPLLFFQFLEFKRHQSSTWWSVCQLDGFDTAVRFKKKSSKEQQKAYTNSAVVSMHMPCAFPYPWDDTEYVDDKCIPLCFEYLYICTRKKKVHSSLNPSQVLEFYDDTWENIIF